MARGKYKGPKRGSGQRNRNTQDEEEDAFRAGQGAGQASNAGQMPPDSSDDEEEEGATQPEAPPQKVVVFGGGMGAPGEMPPNSSSDEEDDSDDDDIQPHGLIPAEPTRRRKKDDEEDPAQIAKDLERLKLIKEKRETERQDRIKKEGWDRYAPQSETNKPPDGRPSDHPDFRSQ